MKNYLLGLALALVTVLPVHAQEFVSGKDYDVISPALRTSSASKIEVAEFFAYSCGHCYNFEPLIETWKQGLANDVVFVGSPAVWAPQMEPHAKAYFAAKALGADQVHSALFAAMHVDRKRLDSDSEIRKIFVDNGIAGKDFDKAFGSFGVSSQVRQAVSRQKGARVTGTPEMMVAGKYRVTTRKAGSQANMLKVADFLIEKERAARQAVSSSQ
mgnify:CR=1 FL=1